MGRDDQASPRAAAGSGKVLERIAALTRAHAADAAKVDFICDELTSNSIFLHRHRDG